MNAVIAATRAPVLKAGMNRRAPLVIRTNRLRGTREELAGRLRSVDIQRLLQAHQRLLWMQLDQRGVAI